MTKVIITLLQASLTIIKHPKIYTRNPSGFLFPNNNIRKYATNEDDQLNQAKAGIDVYFTFRRYFKTVIPHG